jgi:RNA polymerase sigma-70 factor (ECF subfamily)
VNLTERDAVLRVRAGDADAFTAIVDLYHGRLLRYAQQFLGNRADAEDVVQEALVRAYRGMARYEDREQLGAWLLRILVNRCRSHVARRRDVEPLDEEALQWEPGEDRAEAMALRDELGYALALLPTDQREALLLRFVEDLTFDQMSALTGAGVSALKMRVRRACERLRTLMEEHRERV